jgi:dipeptidyl aminopeptidase/acylaminoacyl peptidase
MSRPAALIRHVLVLLAVLLANAAQAAPFTAQDLVMLKRVSDPRMAPDGKRVAYTLRSTDLEANKALRQIWLLDIASGKTRQVTGGSGHSHTPRWSADGQLYFLSNRSGSTQVWRLDAAGGEAQAVTSLPLAVEAFVLAPGGDRIALSLQTFIDCKADLDCSAKRLKERENARSAGQLHDRLFVRHWDTWKNGTRAQLFSAALREGRVSGAPAWISRDLDGDVPAKPFGDDADISFTPDGRALVFAMRVAPRSEAWSTNLDLWRAPADGSAAPENLTADNPAADWHPLLTPDGRQLVWLAHKRAGFESDRAAIRLRDLKTGATRELAAKWDRSPTRIALSADGRALYATADDQGQTPLFVMQLSSGILRKLSGAGTVSAFSVSEEGVVYAQNRLDAPDDLYLLRWNGAQKRLTQHNADRLNGIAMSSTEFFTFRGWNDETVQGYVMKPAGFVPGAKYPIAFLIHGGPQTSMGNDFHYRWNPQVYAGRGYAVVAIDFHGSTGYGQAFTDSISGDWGGKPLLDLQKGLAAALEKYTWLDGTRACALGASYGGYMVNWIAGTWPGAFKCLVNHDGVFDLRSMGYATDELWFTEWEIGGTPYEKPEHYERFNPAQHVAKWATPMLVIHGGQDFRVPLEQGLATFTALQRRGVASQLLVFPEENHWVTEPRNALQWHDAVLGWLDKHLK